MLSESHAAGQAKKLSDAIAVIERAQTGWPRPGSDAVRSEWAEYLAKADVTDGRTPRERLRDFAKK